MDIPQLLKTAAAAGLLVAGIIHIIPLMGLLGAARLQSLYGLPFNDPSLQVLMRHRAVLFGMLGVLLVMGAFMPPLRLLALVAGFVSVFAFLALAAITPGTNEGILKVVRADYIALAGLLLSAGAHIGLQAGG